MNDGQWAITKAHIEDMSSGEIKRSVDNDILPFINFIQDLKCKDSCNVNNKNIVTKTHCIYIDLQQTFFNV